MQKSLATVLHHWDNDSLETPRLSYIFIRFGGFHTNQHFQKHGTSGHAPLCNS